MESGLIFNQLNCEFESRHPRQDIFDFRLPISGLAAHLIVITHNFIKRPNRAIDNWKSSMTFVRRSSIGRAPHCDCGP
jgi:hypothetical protein